MRDLNSFQREIAVGKKKSLIFLIRVVTPNVWFKMNYNKVCRAALPAALIFSGCMAHATPPIGPAAMTEAITPELPITQQCRQHLVAAQTILSSMLHAKSARNETHTLKPYDQMMVELGNASSLAGLFSNVHPNKLVRDAAEKCEQELSEFTTNLSLNRDLYDALHAVDQTKLDTLAARMVQKELVDFKRSGVTLNEADRERVKKLNEELTVISQEFGKNIREDVRFIELDSVADLAGLPADYIKSHQPGVDGKIKITTDYPDYISFMQYALSDAHRQALSTVYLNRGYPKNTAVLQNMITKRHELARLLGYATYAAYKVETMMIKKPENVAAFIKDIVQTTKKAAKEEIDELLAEKKLKHPEATQVFGYESSFLSEQVKRKKFAFDSASVRPYFEYDRVKNALLALVSDMYDIEFRPSTTAEVWHDSVEAYDVFENKQKIGIIYLDMHPRDGKYKHAAQFTVRTGVVGIQLPEGALVCNFPESLSVSEPALMDYDEVVTFFHEFGHLMHHILGGQQTWSRFSGVATEWDFVEAPSQFFEEWAADESVLQRFAKHYQTGEVISSELVKKLKAANEYGKALHAQQQMFYAAMSYEYYSRDPKTFDPLELQIELQNSHSAYPYMPGTHLNLSFGHLDGYSAMYYTYMWSLVIAKDLFTPFKQDGLLNKEHALAFKKHILQPGGTKDASELVKDFLGRSYNSGAFREWLAGS